MAIQDDDALSLAALSIRNDPKPHPNQPTIGDGVHLRWMPGVNRGFPKGGYYAFRRVVSEPTAPQVPNQFCLISAVQGDAFIGTSPSTVASVSVVPSLTHIQATIAVASGTLTPLAPSPQKPAFAGLAMSGRPHTVTYTPSVSSVTASLNVHSGGSVTVRGKLNGAIVFSQTSPAAPTTTTWNCAPAGTVDTVEFTSTATDLLELCCIVGPALAAKSVAGPSAATPVGTTAARRSAATLPGNGWASIPGVATPITLPLVHPQYPVSAGAESLTAAKAIAQPRFHYGAWTDAFDAATPAAGPGTITLTPGSAIATGVNTNWTADLAGKMICMPATGNDYTAYAVMSVLAPDRIVLSRAYSDASANGPYRLLAGDDFAEMHDRVAALVQNAGAMRDTTMPPALDAGTMALGKYAQVANGSTTVQGAGTQWTAALAGTTIDIGPLSSGGTYYAGTSTYGVQSVQSGTQLTLDRPFAGPGASSAFAHADFRIGGTPAAVASGTAADADIKPMDMLQLACLFPGYAQALGLYCIDGAAVAAGVYDYIVLADHANAFNGQTSSALAWLNGTPDFTGGVDACYVMGVPHNGTPPLAAPAHAEAYRLPGAGARLTIANPNRADSDVAISIHDVTSWASAPPGTVTPVMVNLWRHAYGVNQPSAAAAPNTYTDLGRIVPTATAPAAQPPAGWPAAPIHFIDSGPDKTGLDVGWYGYLANAIDLWGRWSPTSAAIPWTIVPPSSPATLGFVHLQDLIAPPPPAGVLAWALDDADPYVLKDAAYVAWKASFGSNPPSTGLRVSWRWPWSLRNQGPDLREFRVYLQSHPINARTGRISAVASVAGNPSARTVTLALDVANTAAAMQGPNYYNGALLYVGVNTFQITGSQASGPAAFTLTVNGAGSTLASLQNGADATIVIPASLPLLHKDLLDQRNWEHWIAAVPESLASTRYDVELVRDATTNSGLQGSGATLNTTTWVLSLNQTVDLTNVVVGSDYAYVATTGATPSDLQFFHLITAVDPAAHTVTLTPSNIVSGSQPLAWKIGLPVRYYEVFLPTPAASPIATPQNLAIAPLIAPTLAQPIAYATVGVSSADCRDDVPDKVTRSPSRSGNESFLAAPATVFRVLRDAPAPPSFTYGVPRLYATKADWRMQSFFTVRWNAPGPGYFAHIFRAMDTSLFLAHWNLTTQIPAPQAPPGVAPMLATFHAHQLASSASPAAWAAEYEAARQQYAALSDEVLAWLAGRPELADAFMQITVAPLDVTDPANHDRVGPDDAASYVPNAARCAYTDQLDGRSSNRYFYAVMLLDGAQNRSPLGAVTPPVYLPKVVAPKAPVLTKAVGDEQKVQLQWVMSRESGVTAYRVYRATSAADAEDIRSMTLIAQLSPLSSLQVAQGEVAWTDTAAPVGSDAFYRITLLDAETPPNESPSSSVGVARAVDTIAPALPVINATWTSIGNANVPHIVVGTPAPYCELSRRAAGQTLWQPVTVPPAEAPGTKTYTDSGAPSGVALSYRAVARNGARIASAAATTTLGPV